jgi:LysR family glycine cleavage system transcriptional activator
MAQPTLTRDPRILRSLQYFEAVARHGSVKAAADEVGVSASAISHQLRELTKMLGEELVEKSGRGIVLTLAGRALACRLAATFEDLEAIISDVVGDKPKFLRLAVCSSFGPAWLAPRLPRFSKACPDVELELRLYSHDPEQTHAIADAIVTANPVKAGYDSIPLFDEMLVAVQKPASRAALITDKHRLITTDILPEELGQDWTRYFASTGTPREKLARGDWIRCTHYLLALELAKSGQGAALVPDFLAEEALAQGSLAYLDRRRVPSGRSYHLCFKAARSMDAEIRLLANWMKAEAAGAVLRFPQPAVSQPIR